MGEGTHRRLRYCGPASDTSKSSSRRSGVRAEGWASVLSPDADNRSDRGAFRSTVPIEKRLLAGKVEAAGIEPASAAAPAERLQA